MYSTNRLNPLLRALMMLFTGVGLCIYLCSCRKLVTIGPPASTITTEQVFADSADAAAGILGIYGTFPRGAYSIGCGFQTIYAGMSADEITGFFSDDIVVQTFEQNKLDKFSDPIGGMWSDSYLRLYHANSAIEGLRAASNISDAVKVHFESEARFFRAFIYFYLVNFFGDIPYTTTSDYTVNAILSRTPREQVYDSIISDLNFCKDNLPDGYDYSGGQRIRINRSCAIAMLSRVYLYLENWQKAKEYAGQIIGNSDFMLERDLNLLYTPNNRETILEWNTNTARSPNNLNFEGLTFNIYNADTPPSFILTPWLLNDFEPGDNRKSAWTKNTTYDGKEYTYPYRYKLGIAQQVRGIDVTPKENYTVLRLAEQYLIRAEAAARLNDLAAATDDINIIRQRAGLPATTASTQPEVLDAIMHERRIELFAEFGHRWFDLKRTGRIDAVLGAIKSTWKPYQALYPLPGNDLKFNPNLIQNPGYF